MYFINGKLREDLEKLVEQKKAHGFGGMSQNLLDAMAPFSANNDHQLVLVLANMLLSIELSATGGVGGGM